MIGVPLTLQIFFFRRVAYTQFCTWFSLNECSTLHLSLHIFSLVTLDYFSFFYCDSKPFQLDVIYTFCVCWPNFLRQIINTSGGFELKQSPLTQNCWQKHVLILALYYQQVVLNNINNSKLAANLQFMPFVTHGATFQDSVLHESTFYSQTEQLDQNLHHQWVVCFEKVLLAIQRREVSLDVPQGIIWLTHLCKTETWFIEMLLLSHVLKWLPPLLFP